LFKVTGDYGSVDAALAAVAIFASALVDLLVKKGAWNGLISGIAEDA
jgi:hypothetical protein